MTADTPPATSKSILRAADRYQARLARGERIMRLADGRLQWASGQSVGRKTVRHMMDNGLLAQLDSDLFGDPSRGQTLGPPG